jgi:hypothetical protein
LSGGGHGLRLLEFAGLDALGADRESFHRAVGQSDLNLLDIPFEGAAGDAGGVQSDASAFLGQAVPDDFIAKAFDLFSAGALGGHDGILSKRINDNNVSIIVDRK